MRVLHTKIISFAAIIMFAMASSVMAAGSGGLRMELLDAGAHGKGSAFVGEANTPSAIYYNPAGLTQMDGSQISAGFSILAPSTSHTDFAGNETQMQRQNFKVPHLYMVSDLGLEKWTFGVGGTSNWGSATAWADDSFSRYSATKSDIIMFNSLLTASYKASERWSFALGADNVYSTSNRSKKLLQQGGADGDFSFKADDTAWGYRLATHFALTEEHKFGLMYRSPMQLKYRGKVFLNELNASGSNYFAIFGGDDSFEVDAFAELELPQSVILGYSFQPEDSKWLLNFDIEWMDWSSAEQDRIEFTEVLTANQAAILNAGNPAPADWHEAWSAALGVEYDWNEDLRLRTGAYYHTSPIPDDTFNSNLPDANSLGLSAGFGYDINDKTTVDLAYSALLFEDRTIDNAVGSSAGANLDGEYEQIMHMGLVTLTYDF